MSKYYHITTYGCQMNVHESEKIAGILSGLGYESCENAEDADIVVVNKRLDEPPELQPPAHKGSLVITWDYDPLFAAVLDDNQSLRGYYLHGHT